MIRNRLLFGGLAALVALAASRAPTQEPAAAVAAGEARTIWDSVYTDAQARRGERVAAQVCVACHSASEWSRSEFLAGWNGRPVADLFDQIHNAMPKDAPGSLPREQYVDLITYMFRLNKVPSGAAELGADQAALRAITIRFPRP